MNDEEISITKVNIILSASSILFIIMFFAGIIFQYDSNTIISILGALSAIFGFILLLGTIMIFQILNG